MDIEAKHRRDDSTDEPREDATLDSEPAGRERAPDSTGEQGSRRENPTGTEGHSETTESTGCWGLIWKSFAENRKKSSSAAWSRLQLDMALNADKIVGEQLNGKDFTAMMSEVEERIKNDMGSGSADPSDALSKWLQGDEGLTVQ